MSERFVVLCDRCGVEMGKGESGFRKIMSRPVPEDFSPSLVEYTYCPGCYLAMRNFLAETVAVNDINPWDVLAPLRDSLKNRIRDMQAMIDRTNDLLKRCEPPTLGAKK